MHEIMFMISSYADIDLLATPTTLSPVKVVIERKVQISARKLRKRVMVVLRDAVL